MQSAQQTIDSAWSTLEDFPDKDTTLSKLSELYDLFVSNIETVKAPSSEQLRALTIILENPNRSILYPATELLTVLCELFPVCQTFFGIVSSNPGTGIDYGPIPDYVALLKSLDLDAGLESTERGDAYTDFTKMLTLALEALTALANNHPANQTSIARQLQISESAFAFLEEILLDKDIHSASPYQSLRRPTILLLANLMENHAENQGSIGMHLISTLLSTLKNMNESKTIEPSLMLTLVYLSQNEENKEKILGQTSLLENLLQHQDPFVSYSTGLLLSRVRYGISAKIKAETAAEGAGAAAGSVSGPSTAISSLESRIQACLSDCQYRSPQIQMDALMSLPSMLCTPESQKKVIESPKLLMKLLSFLGHELPLARETALTALNLLFSYHPETTHLMLVYSGVQGTLSYLSKNETVPAVQSALQEILLTIKETEPALARIITENSSNTLKLNNLLASLEASKGTEKGPDSVAELGDFLQQNLKISPENSAVLLTLLQDHPQAQAYATQLLLFLTDQAPLTDEALRKKICLDVMSRTKINLDVSGTIDTQKTGFSAPYCFSAPYGGFAMHPAGMTAIESLLKPQAKSAEISVSAQAGAGNNSAKKPDSKASMASKASGLFRNPLSGLTGRLRNAAPTAPYTSASLDTLAPTASSQPAPPAKADPSPAPFDDL